METMATIDPNQNPISMKMVLESPNIVCECGCKIFVPAVVLKRVSALLSPTGREEAVDIPVYVCAKCGEIPSFYKDKANYKIIFGDSEISKE